MAYEPRGKVKLLADAMAADPQRIWTSPEVAEVMDVNQGALSAHLDPAIRHRAIFRKLEHGRCQYSLKPFPEEQRGSEIVVPEFGAQAAAAAADAAGAESKHVRSPGATGFVPPQMTAPRPGSDERMPARAPGTPPAPMQAGAPQGGPAPQPLAPIPSPAPVTSPAPTPAPLPVAAAQEEPSPEEAEEEPVEPKAFVDVGSGDVILVGCEVDEDGRVTVPSELVRKIVGRMAWSPLR